MTAPDQVTDGAAVEDVEVAAVEVAAVERCSVCGHDTPAHDAIGLRYCRATQENALTRHCICRV